MLAAERKVSASTHNQALSALLFLYREVLDIALSWLENINRTTNPKRIPPGLTKDEAAGVLAALKRSDGLASSSRCLSIPCAIRLRFPDRRPEDCHCIALTSGA